MTLTLFRGRIKVPLTIALHLTLNISDRDRLDAWYMGHQMVTWPMTSRDPDSLKGQTRDPNACSAL